MDFRLPELGEGVYEAELVRWLVKPGDTVKRGQSLMEVLTDKASMEVPSPFAGTITVLRADPGNNIKVKDAVLSYTPAGAGDGKAGPSDNRHEESGAAAAPAQKLDGNRAAPRPDVPAHRFAELAYGPAAAVKAAPSVRYMARKLGIDLARVPGTGPGGRILIGDLSAHVKRTGPEAAPAPTEPAPDYGKPGTRIKLQGLRRKIAEHLVLAKRTIPHYSYVDECDVTDLVRLREVLRPSFAQAGVRLTYLTFFVKAVVAGLKDVPIVNSSLDESADEIVLHDHYHIGIAVATPNGLIVPVLHDADQKDLAQVAQEIEQLTTQSRAGKVRLEDLRGGTFTITSIGGVGGLIATPIINHPEVAILGVGKIVKRPVFDAAGNVKPADLVYLSFSFDHRVLDGAVGAVFGNAVIQRLQNPATLLLRDKLL
jgi:pyruvate dehydrogenase E2 component (dihydrolipoamide acetyltransferase)/2-oxoisovalerate dehydrogenase E2 component (dihydrolipoyl transacylase)